MFSSYSSDIQTFISSLYLIVFHNISPLRMVFHHICSHYNCSPLFPLVCPANHGNCTERRDCLSLVTAVTWPQLSHSLLILPTGQSTSHLRRSNISTCGVYAKQITAQTWQMVWLAVWCKTQHSSQILHRKFRKCIR